MRRFITCGTIFAALCFAQSPPNSLTSKEASEGWVPLFDGKSLKGWEGRATSVPNTTGLDCRKWRDRLRWKGAQLVEQRRHVFRLRAETGVPRRREGKQRRFPAVAEAR